MNMQVTANQEVETNGRVPYLGRQRKRGDLSAPNLNMGLFLLSFPFLSPRESLVETNHFWVEWRFMTRAGDRPVVPAAAALEISVQGASAGGLQEHLCTKIYGASTTLPQAFHIHHTTYT